MSRTAKDKKKKKKKKVSTIFISPVSVAQSDACPIGDQEVAGPIPPGPAKFLLED